MKSKVLVTGANGQLGKTLREVSNNFVDSMAFVFVEKSELDITKKDEVDRFFKQNNFDYCINCAAYTNVDLAETEIEKAIDVNANAVKHLALSCKTYDATLVHVSTDYVFDGTKTQAYTEDDTTNPINSYGKSKRLGEQYIEEIIENHFIIRTSWLYSKFNKNFVTTIFNKLINDEKLTIITSQKGTPTSCLDLSNFIVFLISNAVKSYGIYHFSANGNTTWYGLGAHIATYLNKGENVSPIKEYPSKAKRPMYSILDNKKVEKLTNKPLKNWEESVDNVLKSLSKG